ncbi:hypothetical protein RCL1_008867 [Eukaryota sp. TZLM3-RCL]
MNVYSLHMQGQDSADSQNQEQHPQIQISDDQSQQQAVEMLQQATETVRKTLRPPPASLLSPPPPIISPTLKCKVVKTSTASLRRNVLIPQIQQQQSLTLEELPAIRYCSEHEYPWMLICVFPRIFACRDGCLYIPKC